MENFKITLEAARVNAGLTQAELAKKMGVSRESVRAWETGAREMKTAYFYIFCDIVGISKDYIFLPHEFAESEQKGGNHERRINDHDTAHTPDVSQADLEA